MQEFLTSFISADLFIVSKFLLLIRVELPLLSWILSGTTHIFLNFFFHYLFERNRLGLLLTTNDISAQKDLVFSVTRRIYKLKPLADELRCLTE